ncbi:hypothetical protein BD408DRAFT_433862 [Parasitella parasitica]|nr:hypothetical protein BD408DRAFT_433862 [Parasitella parasitica]
MSKKDAADAHDLFLKYNRTFVQLYTAEFVRPYNHLLMHLAQNILDFGSVVRTWCFSYERYNYLLKPIDTSQRGHFERTIMRKFVEKSNSMSMINEYGSVLQDEEQALLFNIANANGHIKIILAIC